MGGVRDSCANVPGSGFRSRFGSRCADLAADLAAGGFDPHSGAIMPPIGQTIAPPCVEMMQRGFSDYRGWCGVRARHVPPTGVAWCRVGPAG